MGKPGGRGAGPKATCPIKRATVIVPSARHRHEEAANGGGPRSKAMAWAGGIGGAIGLGLVALQVGDPYFMIVGPVAGFIGGFYAGRRA